MLCCALSLQLCPTLWALGSCVHGMFQARTLGSGFPFPPAGDLQPRDGTLSKSFHSTGRFFTIEPQSAFLFYSAWGQRTWFSFNLSIQSVVFQFESEWQNKGSCRREVELWLWMLICCQNLKVNHRFSTDLWNIIAEHINTNIRRDICK